MPIVVDYSPIGTMGQLAVQAGRNVADQQSFVNALRLREQRSNDTRGLLQYVAQQKALQEDARRFDLTRADEQTRFSASLGAQAANRQMQTEAQNQAFSLQQAAQSRLAATEQRKWLTAETPEQKYQMSMMMEAGKKAIEYDYKIGYENAKASNDIAKQMEANRVFADRVDQYAEMQKERTGMETIDREASKLAGRFVELKTPKAVAPKTPRVGETAETRDLRRELNGIEKQYAYVTSEYKSLATASYKLQGEKLDRFRNLEQQKGALETQREAVRAKLFEKESVLEKQQQEAQRSYQLRPTLPGGGQAAADPTKQMPMTQPASSDVIQLARELKQQYPDYSDEQIAELLKVLAEARNRGR